MADRSTTYDRLDAIAWMREASPYIRAHRGQIFVVYFGGEAIDEHEFDGLVQDLILLRSLGIKLIVVHGSRPQIDRKVEKMGIDQAFVGNLRITDIDTLTCVKDAVCAVRIELEAHLSQAALDIPNRGSTLTVSGGNFIIARPAGIVGGVDLCFTGDVRRIDRQAIERRLDDGELVLISPLGYSPTGEVFNLNSLDLATAVACEVKASKLVLMMDPPGLVDRQGNVARQLTARDVRNFLSFGPANDRFIECAIRACQFGVGRVHVVDRSVDGVLIEELYTRDGVGTLISNAPFDQLRSATVEDLGGVLALIQPLEQEGFLVKRSREKLEIEIDHFCVIVRESVVIACGALYPCTSDMGEIACVVVHPDYRRDGFGNIVLGALERRAREADLCRVFVLTTHASHWFQENGYTRTGISALPNERQTLYNYQRNSIVLSKRL